MTAPTTAPAEPYVPNNKPHYAKSYTDAIEMQKVLMRDILSPSTTGVVRVRLIDAWDKLEDRKRILRNKPLPGSLVHDKVRPGKRQRQLGESMLASMVAEQQPATTEQPDSPA